MRNRECITVGLRTQCKKGNSLRRLFNLRLGFRRGKCSRVPVFIWNRTKPFAAVCTVHFAFEIWKTFSSFAIVWCLKSEPPYFINGLMLQGQTAKAQNLYDPLQFQLCTQWNLIPKKPLWDPGQWKIKKNAHVSSVCTPPGFKADIRVGSLSNLRRF